MAQDRSERRPADPGAAGESSVGLFVDYENLRRSIEHNFSPAPTPQLLCEKLYEMATRFGRVLLANAYADWSISQTDPRDFRRRQIEPRLVLTKENGDDRTDITMSLDALETLFVQPDIDLYVIASGDSDFHDLLQRLRRRGKRIVVCGARGDTGRELIRGADTFVPLEDLLGVRGGRTAAPVDWETYDYSDFIRLIRDLDRKLNFVGLRYVATKVLNPHNCGLSDRSQKQELLNRAIDLGIIEPYQVENIEEGGEPVSACRLNPEHPLVVEVMSREEDQGAEPETTEDAPAPAAQPSPGRGYHSSVDGDDLGRPGESAD